MCCAMCVDIHSKPGETGLDDSAGSELVDIVQRSIGAAFVDDSVKDILRMRLEQHVSSSVDH